MNDDGEKGRGRRTLGAIGSLVVVCEPGQVLVLDPWHPCLVLLVVVLASLLLVGLAVAVVLVRHDEVCLVCTVKDV